jgi:hypothetical protein
MLVFSLWVNMYTGTEVDAHHDIVFVLIKDVCGCYLICVECLVTSFIIANFRLYVVKLMITGPSLIGMPTPLSLSVITIDISKNFY